MATGHPYYLVWTGSLNLGDTAGVFNNAQFAGLILQIPVTLTYVPGDGDQIEFVLVTTDVEIFGGKKHAVYWDWAPGTPLVNPVGFIDDTELFPGRIELHLLKIPKDLAKAGSHSITIVVNSDVAAGMKDDFVLMRIEASDSIGARIGW
jgi:hypothetical protein